MTNFIIRRYYERDAAPEIEITNYLAASVVFPIAASLTLDQELPVVCKVPVDLSRIGQLMEFSFTGRIPVTGRVSLHDEHSSSVNFDIKTTAIVEESFCFQSNFRVTNKHQLHDEVCFSSTISITQSNTVQHDTIPSIGIISIRNHTAIDDSWQDRVWADKPWDEWIRTTGIFLYRDTT